ncbi:MAG: hypothetical protein PHI66_03150 [Candidatus Pacebacteria bacterium]|nr:hypothetical protein [Candidatus Paceibacterota bacterium]
MIVKFKMIFFITLIFSAFSFFVNFTFADNINYLKNRTTEQGMSVSYNENSSEIVFENKGKRPLTNIAILKDKELIEVVPLLESGESELLDIPLINGIIDKEYLPANNTGWVTIRNDQGDEENLVYWYVTPHASKLSPYPNPFFWISYLPAALLVTFIAAWLTRYVLNRVFKK